MPRFITSMKKILKFTAIIIIISIFLLSIELFFFRGYFSSGIAIQNNYFEKQKAIISN